MSLPAVVWAGISAATSLASGVVGYIGAQRKADFQEDLADNAQQWGQFRGQIERNNAMAQSHDLNFQAGVEKFNQRTAINARDFRQKLSERRARQSVASTKAAAARRGLIGESLDDMLESEAMLTREESMEVFRQGSERAYQFGTQGRLNQRMARRSIEQGRINATMAVHEGNAVAASYRSQAASSRWNAVGSLASGIGGAALTGMNYELGTS